MGYLFFPFLIFVLSLVSSMLGVGVAVISTPVLGLFGFDLEHVLMPWSLLMNGLAATSGAIGYTRSRMVDWRTALPVLVVSALAAPLGVWLLRLVPTNVVWWVYVGALIFVACHMAFASTSAEGQERTISDADRVKAGLLSAPISVLAGFLGVGPDFLMIPTLTMLGYTARIAAATNSAIVTLPSFSAFVAHLDQAQLDWVLVGMTCVTAIVGAYYGGMPAARGVKSRTVSRVFAGVLVLLAIARIVVLLTR
ncbi:MAG: sulfite exporter TauE/SafE family protein [Chloroflexi bacterium]|nr:sulfite exporter TauE/SafE family protein [Chloroflexota bacterium]